MYCSKMRLGLKIAYVTSMVIAFTSRYGNMEVSYRPQIVIGIAWILIGIVKFVCDGFCFKGIYGEDLRRFLGIYLFPHIVIHVYTIILIMLGYIEKGYMTTNLTVYVPVILSIMSIYLFEKSAFKMMYLALILSWILSLSCSVFEGGISVLWDAIRQGYLGHSVRNYLELHDMVFGLGYVLIFVGFTKKRWNRYNLFLIMTSILIILLGIKRIQIAALFLVLALGIALKFASIKTHYRYSSIVCLVLFLGSYLFIYLMSDEAIVQSLSGIVDMKGRYYYYTTILKLSEFTLTYPGIGRNVITRLLTSTYKYMSVAGVHSDIIKMYVENGFILFGFWLWYYLFHIRHYYKKKYGYKVAIMYSVFTIYTYILYFTDNIEIYFITQMMNMTLMMTLALDKKVECTRRLGNE